MIVKQVTPPAERHFMIEVSETELKVIRRTSEYYHNDTSRSDMYRTVAQHIVQTAERALGWRA